MSLFKFLFKRAAYRREQLDTAYQRGRQCACTLLRQAGEGDVVEECARLSRLADDAFENTGVSRAFDRGVQDVVSETLTGLGMP